VAAFLASFQQGADPASVYNAIPTGEERDVPVTWAMGWEIEQAERDQLEAVYLAVWYRWNVANQTGSPADLASAFTGPALAFAQEGIAAGVPIEQRDLAHHLTLTFYSADKSIATFTDVVQIERMLPSTVTRTEERYEVLLTLEDGLWRVRQWRRVASEGGLPESAR
jgi:hypothetical protein